jgi:large subunit ribosomal protein L13
MTTKTTTKEIRFDAEGKSLGRMATEVAMALRGKDQPDFQSHVAPDLKVIIDNASKVNLSNRQLEETYKRYSGYPGGLKHESRKHVIDRKGYREVFEKAVYGMLPNNKLRAVMMNNLTINE